MFSSKGNVSIISRKRKVNKILLLEWRDLNILCFDDDEIDDEKEK